MCWTVAEGGPPTKQFRISIAAFLTAWNLLACSEGGGQTDAAADEETLLDAAAEQGELPEASVDGAGEPSYEVADIADEEGGEITCESVLKPWECLDDSFCQEGATCIGEGPCQDPPCWGVCHDYPGSCMITARPEVCQQDSDCSDGVCGGVARDPDTGKPVWLGLCRPRPFKGACYDDDDCQDGEYCTGEVRCTTGRPCLGAEFPVVCVSKPAQGRCCEDTDCGSGQKCQGVVLCIPGDEACSQTQGECMPATTAPGCQSDGQCPSGWRSTAAYSCPGEECSFLPQPGFCIESPGFRRCFEDDDCATSFVCRGSLTCPPGSLCAATHSAHPGLCGEIPSGGVMVGSEVSEASRGQTVRLYLLNDSAVTIFLDPCYPMFVQFWAKEKKKWQDYWKMLPGHPEACDKEGGGIVAFPVPQGAGLGIPATLDLPGKYRVQVQFWVGCSQGLKWPFDCKTEEKITVYSQPFEVK